MLLKGNDILKSPLGIVMANLTNLERSVAVPGLMYKVAGIDHCLALFVVLPYL